MRSHIVAVLILILLGQSLSNLNSNNYDIDSLNDDLIVKQTQNNINTIVSNSTNLGVNQSMNIANIASLTVIDLIMDDDNNIYICFKMSKGNYNSPIQIDNYSSNSSEDLDTWIFAKFDFNRSLVWAFNSTNLGSAPKMKLTSNQSLVIVSSYVPSIANTITTFYNQSGTKSLFIATFNPNGNMTRFVKANPPTSIGVDNFVIDSNDNIYIYGFVGCQSCTAPISFGTSTFYVAGATDFFAKLNSSGNWDWGISTTGNSWAPSNLLMSVDSNDDLIIAADLSLKTGNWGVKDFLGVSRANEHPEQLSGTNNGCLLFKMYNHNRTIKWHKTIYGESGATLKCNSIDVDSQNNIFIGGSYNEPFRTHNGSTSPYGGKDAYVAKFTSSGNLSWVNYFGGTGDDEISSIVVGNNGFVSICGYSRSTTMSVDNGFLTGNVPMIFFIQMDNYSNYTTRISSNGIGDELNCLIESSTNGEKILFYQFTTQTRFSDISHTSVKQTDLAIFEFSSDYDRDGVSDYRDYDDDDDGILDRIDRCQHGLLDWTSNTVTDHDADGCVDKTEDVDDDNDAVNDQLDNCSLGSVNWISNNTSDIDGDGCQDSGEDDDDDNDGFIDLNDLCPRVFGNSTYLSEFGCIDTDGDTRPDITDFKPKDASEWNDADNDGFGDNEDLYPYDFTQNKDSDNDSYGDNSFGTEGDYCPQVYGNSTIDVFGCIDSDGDGWSNDGDADKDNPTQWQDRDGDGYGDNQSGTNVDMFPSDGTQWNDTDGDGHGDNPYGTQGDWFPDDPTRWRDSDQDATADEDDAFPNDGTQQVDSDGDGYGDNIDGNRGDSFPNDPNEWKDSDGDGLGDNADLFPYDPTQIEDRDGDGMGDNPMGIGADKFPDDATQWGDIDGDGYGDNQLGNNPDLFITDATQWADRDGDGYGDNPQGRLYDLFPDNPTQWEDDDEDGLGDNLSGTDADPFLNDFDNDGFNDSIDILPKLASPGDLDADGCLDEVDAFPENSQECVDTDGDGIGNNGDSDDDGDGWTDADEERLNTDSLSASSKPVDSFEIVIPGTAVGLGAWDLIGMFGGIPLAFWIGFGFATRNGRCARYEGLLKEATSRDELEQVALRWEYSLMLRMLGPHQGIRLERLRAELDDKFENATYDETDVGFDQTSIVENEGKDIPPINESFTGPTKETTATYTDESEYEWFNQEGQNWYRPAGSNDEWLKFEN